jgi:capsular polysaccharide biosynthesis protein
MKRRILEFIDHSYFMPFIYRMREIVLPHVRQEQKKLRADFHKLQPIRINNQKNAAPFIGRVCIVGGTTLETAVLQFPLILAAKSAGYSVHILITTPNTALEEIFSSCGVDDFIFLNRYLGEIKQNEFIKACKNLEKISDVLDIFYKNINCGKFALSTYLRQSRGGKVDFSDKVVLNKMKEKLYASFRNAEAANKILLKNNFDIICFFDRGYTPDGELFEAALNNGANAITMNAAHKGGSLLFKRYGRHNEYIHPATLSEKTWSQARSMEWTDQKWDSLFLELKGCYETGQWFNEVGTQVNKIFLDKQAIIKELGLDPEKKTAVVFTHIFWDATFFWGEDLFDDYEHWFVETLKVAAEQTDVNWIFKSHPANTVKNTRDKFSGENVELTAVRRALGELPVHIKLLEAGHSLSTFSLFSMMDYCLTVRGTIGMEAACFGVPVITAGTGRYDRLGFTYDHSSQEEYKLTLKNLNNLTPMSEDAIELARRYLYAVLMMRPIKVNTITFEYGADALATLHVTINKSESNPVDIDIIKSWLLSGDDDLINESRPKAYTSEY